MRNALFISLALTALVVLYFLISGKSMQGNEVLSYAGGLFGGVLIFLWFKGRRKK